MRVREIEWDEALATATQWLGGIRSSDPRKLAFFTGRDQSQALTGWWASQFGTPNYAAHGGFCSVNMAAAGIYTFGGSFWEFGEADWERSPILHAVRLRRGSRIESDQDRARPIEGVAAPSSSRSIPFAPVIRRSRTNGSASGREATGCWSLALVHELLNAGKVDLDYLIRYTNAPWLVIQDAGAADDGLIARFDAGVPLVWDRVEQPARARGDPDIRPALKGEVTLPDGRRARPVFRLIVERYLRRLQPRGGGAAERHPRPDHPSDRCGARGCGVRSGGRAGRAMARCQGRRHERMIGRPVGMHAMRGISAHSNGFHTCRAIHLLQILLGTIDMPGGFRYRPPYPKPIPPGPKPAGKRGRDRAGRADARAAARLSAAPRTSWSSPTALPAASTKPIPGRRRSPPTAFAYGDQATPTPAIPTRSTCCSCIWRTWAGTRR